MKTFAVRSSHGTKTRWSFHDDYEQAHDEAISMESHDYHDGVDSAHQVVQVVPLERDPLTYHYDTISEALRGTPDAKKLQDEELRYSVLDLIAMGVSDLGLARVLTLAHESTGYAAVFNNLNACGLQ